MINAIRISPEDNVVVVIEHIKAGDNIVYRDFDDVEKTIVAKDDVRIFHKVLINDVKKDSFIIKYGEHIGVASKDIVIGEHVHSHNVEERRENLEDKE